MGGVELEAGSSKLEALISRSAMLKRQVVDKLPKLARLKWA